MRSFSITAFSGRSGWPAATLEESFGLSLYGDFLAGDFQAADFAGAPNHDLEFEFSADLLAALHADQGIGHQLETFRGNLGLTNPAMFNFWIQSAPRVPR